MKNREWMTIFVAIILGAGLSVNAYGVRVDWYVPLTISVFGLIIAILFGGLSRGLLEE